MPNDLTTTTQGNQPAIYERIADPIAAATTIGAWIHRAGVMKKVNSADAGAFMALAAMSEGLNVAEFARRYELIEGKLCMKAEAMRAAFLDAGGRYDVLDWTDERCRINWQWDDAKGERSAEVEFTIDDAKRAGLLNRKGPWHTYPREMLFARNTSRFMRAYRPDVTQGYYTSEEIADGRHAPEPASDQPRIVQRIPATVMPSSEPEAEDVVDVEAEPAGADPEPESPAELPETPEKTWQETTDEIVDEPEHEPASAATVKELAGLLESHGVAPAVVKQKLGELYGVASIKDLSQPQIESLLSEWRAALKKKSSEAT